MRYILQKIWNILSKREHVYVLGLIIALVVSAVFELVGIGLIMP